MPALILRIEGDIDLYNAPELRSMFEQQAASGVRFFVLNLSAVNYIDSSGIGVVIYGLNLVRKIEGRVMLVKLPDQIRRLLEMSKLMFFFTIFDTEEEAIASIS
jgi:anti-sigma B factor antagonist